MSVGNQMMIEAGIFLKEQHPPSEVIVRDVRNNVQTLIGWKNGSTFSCDVVSLPQSSATHLPRSNLSCAGELPPRENYEPPRISARPEP
jgi:hypothetical protein